MTTARSVQIWSAAPTPLHADLTVDVRSVGSAVADALSAGIQGVFLAGTCGEGPWLPDRERGRLVSAAATAAKGRLTIAVQATDNSVPRILENIRQIADEGADCAIIAPPPTFLNATPERITRLFIDAAAASPLPIGVYDLGRRGRMIIPDERLQEVYLHPNVRLIKDSSGAPARREVALAARQAKPALQLFNGDEFQCLDYLQAGYDGLMFGGAAAVAPQLTRIVGLFIDGRLEEARAAEAEMKSVLYGIYGGKNIGCWLTGLKYYMVQRGLFSSTASYLGYPLTDECRAFIERYAATDNGVAVAGRLRGARSG